MINNIINLTDLISQQINKQWNGKEAILYLKSKNYNWRQMEWIGFYFEKMVKDIATSNFPNSKENFPKVNKVSFDLFLDKPIDIKSHSISDFKKNNKNEIIVNDFNAIMDVIKSYQETYLIVSCGIPTYDDVNTRSFQKWHQDLKGNKSNYIQKKIKEGAPSRIRKTSFTLVDLYLIKVDKKLIENSGSFFQEGMKNSNDIKRNKKLMINLAKIPDENIIKKYNFK